MQIVFLASNRVAGHTTGQVVMVHGGMEGELLHGLCGGIVADLGGREVVESQAVGVDGIGSALLR